MAARTAATANGIMPASSPSLSSLQNHVKKCQPAAGSKTHWALAAGPK
jgi:hypothetical protein